MKEPTVNRRHAAPAPLRTSLSLLLPLAVVVAFLLLVVGGFTGVTRWFLFDEAGTQWLLKRLPLVQVKGFQGALLGTTWKAERVELTWNQGQESVTLEGLDSSGMRWTWRPDEHALAALHIDSFSVRKITVHTGKPGPRPIPLPAGINTPLALTVARARVDELRIDDLPAVERLAFQGLVLEARPGAEHRVAAVQADWQGLHADASLKIGTNAPLPLAVQAMLRPAGEGDAPRWAAVLSAGGNVAQVQISGTLRGVPLPGREPPAVDLQAGLQPLQAWPLTQLNLQTAELDLSALSVKAPQTRIKGRAVLAARARDAPISATLQVDNALPGRWNEGRLPVQHITAELRGDLRQPDRLEAQAFDIRLADAKSPAGRLVGSAVWQGHELKLDARLNAVTPQRLDSRAAAMKLSGPVQATLRGLPAPGGNTAPAATASKSASAPGAASANAASQASPSLSWKIDLNGTLDAAPQPVQLAMEGNATDQRLEITQLRAASGNATANLGALLQRVGKAGTAAASSGRDARDGRDWQLETTGALVDFDPKPWFPGDPGSAWRQGPHRLSADWRFDLRLPANVANLPALELAQRLAGNGTLRVHDSVLAGVPVSADVKLGYTQATAPAVAQLVGDIQLGNNRISIDGRGDPAGNGQADRWRAELKGDALATLAPLMRLYPALANWAPRQGTATAVVAADGRWPHVRTEGNLRISQLQSGTLSVATAQADWRLDSSGDKALSVKLDLAGLVFGGQRADHLRADLSGTLADHRIDINAAMPLLPPEAAVQLLGVQAQSGTRAQMLGQGAWLPDPGGSKEGGGRWRARIDRLVVGSWDGSPTDSAPASLWAQARDLQAELQFNADGRLVALQANPGHVQITDNVTLRWDEVKGDFRGEKPRLELHADIDPFALAPLLARLQPGIGWSGDIRLAARVDIRAAERFDADLIFERRDGDLHIAGSDGMQLLGLTELRATLTAHDGAWTLTPVLKGRILGEVTGSVRVQTTPERRWPHADAVLTGEVQARVADLGIWAAWVPPGWRLGGELRTVATLSGRFGEPRYGGEVTGSGLSLRNLLLGVNVSDGQVSARLEGDKATIERFTLKGGDGTLNVSGGATLGKAPQAKLQIKADRFRALGRVDRLATASGLADLTLSAEQVRLEGRIKLDEGLFDASRGDAPSLDSDVTVRRAGEVEPAANDPRVAAPRRNVVLALEVDLGDKTRVRGRGLDTGLSGKVRMSTPGGRLEVRGTINADEGTYAAYGQKLQLERGVVAFSGPPDDPRLDILALRPNIDTRVGVVVNGTLQSPRIRLYSEPDMSDTEKLSWLVLGRAPDGLGRSDTALLQRAAVALLSGEGEAPTDALLKSLGIDELGLKQSDADVRETVITLGKQLSRRWYLGYERGLNATTGTWQLIYRIAQRFTLRAQSGLENSLDIIWTWRLQETPADAAMRKSTVVPR